MGLRQVPVDRYIMFYLADETKATVKIVRIFYSGQDIEEALKI